MPKKFEVRSITLETELVRLEPRELGHAVELFEAGGHADILRYLVVARPRSVAELEELLRLALKQGERGVEVPQVHVQQGVHQVQQQAVQLPVQTYVHPLQAFGAALAWHTKFFLAVPDLRTASRCSWAT